MRVGRDCPGEGEVSMHLLPWVPEWKPGRCVGCGLGLGVCLGSCVITTIPKTGIFPISQTLHGTQWLLKSFHIHLSPGLYTHSEKVIHLHGSIRRLNPEEASESPKVSIVSYVRKPELEEGFGLQGRGLKLQLSSLRHLFLTGDFWGTF